MPTGVSRAVLSPLRPVTDTVDPSDRTAGTEARPALPKEATPAGTRAEAGRPTVGSGATASPQAAATDAPAAIEARTAARIGDRCRGGEEGRTVGTGSRKEADGIPKPAGGRGTGGTGWAEGPPGAGGPEGAAPRPMSEDIRLVGTPVSVRSEAMMRRSWSAAERHIAQQTTWRS